MKRLVTAGNTPCISGGASPASSGTLANPWPRRLFAILLLIFSMTFASYGRGQEFNTRSVLLLDLKDAIGFVASSRLTNALERAKAQGARLMVVRLDTPGGLLSSTRDMVQAMLASPIPIVVYVAPSGARAASAGTYLVYASHLAAMAPGTHLGAATPVSLGVPGLPGSPPPKESPDKEKSSEPGTAEERKSVNDAAAYLRTLAQLKNRNAEWAEKAVREAATLTASEALKEHVIEVIANDVDEMLAAIDGRSVATAGGEIRLATKGSSVVELKPDWKMRVMSTITDPNIAFILMLIGIYGILFEFMSPGAVAPGVVGSVSLIVALTALSVLPVSYGGLALLLLGIALMVGEAFAPSFGILGLGGVAAFVVGALFLFDPAEADFQFAVAWPVVASTAAVSAMFFAGVLGYTLKARRRAVRTGAEEMIGSTGEVINWSGDHGHIRAHGEIWAAQSQKNFPIGRKVRVLGRLGLTLFVEDAG